MKGNQANSNKMKAKVAILYHKSTFKVKTLNRIK